MHDHEIRSTGLVKQKIKWHGTQVGPWSKNKLVANSHNNLRWRWPKPSGSRFDPSQIEGPLSNLFVFKEHNSILKVINNHCQASQSFETSFNMKIVKPRIAGVENITCRIVEKHSKRKRARPGSNRRTLVVITWRIEDQRGNHSTTRPCFTTPIRLHILFAPLCFLFSFAALQTPPAHTPGGCLFIASIRGLHTQSCLKYVNLCCVEVRAEMVLSETRPTRLPE